MPRILQTVTNFRDVGETVNRCEQTKWIAPRMLFRSARPDESSLADRDYMRSVLGIKTIIDLRTFIERRQQANKRYVRLKNSLGMSVNDIEDCRPLRIANIDYININFNGYSYLCYLIMQLNWLDFFCFFLAVILRHHRKAINIIGLNVMQPRGLSGLAIDSIDICQSKVKSVFTILANAARYPILIHCTQGKDRTGLIVQLILLLLCMPIEAINNDYMLSSYELALEKGEKLLEVHSIGLTDDFTDCDPNLVRTVDRHIKTNYGSVEQYLVECGVSLEMQLKVKQILHVNPGFKRLSGDPVHIPQVQPTDQQKLLGIFRTSVSGPK